MIYDENKSKLATIYYISSIDDTISEVTFLVDDLFELASNWEECILQEGHQEGIQYKILNIVFMEANTDHLKQNNT